MGGTIDTIARRHSNPARVLLLQAPSAPATTATPAGPPSPPTVLIFVCSSMTLEKWSTQKRIVPPGHPERHTGVEREDIAFSHSGGRFCGPGTRTTFYGVIPLDRSKGSRLSRKSPKNATY